MQPVASLAMWALSIVATAVVTRLFARWYADRRVLSWAGRQWEIGWAEDASEMKLLYRDTPVARVAWAGLRIENTGNRALRSRHELLSPLVVRPPQGARLLWVDVAKQACDAVRARVEGQSESEATVTFAALNPGEWFILQIVHDGLDARMPRLEGRLIGASVVPAVRWDRLANTALWWQVVICGASVAAMVGVTFWAIAARIAELRGGEPPITPIAVLSLIVAALTCLGGFWLAERVHHAANAYWRAVAFITGRLRPPSPAADAESTAEEEGGDGTAPNDASAV
ncbi:MAG: hypothetical protein FJX74_04525 [Armatimonadetes bacterium]|nr:hypothetical protein [Armatimonadota bacterium]